MLYAERLEVVSKNIMKRWKKLLASKKLGSKTTDIFSALTASYLSKMYGEEWRRYHTFMHLDRMVTEFDTVRGKLTHPELVLFAIFLHDIIYVVGRKDNEIKSARVAKEWLRIMGADALTIRRVVRLITVATKHPKSPKARLTNDEKFMSDFDLYGFSLSWDTVLGQTRDVRREFAVFSDDEFRNGQAAFVSRLMNGRVYHTEHYRRYEVKAKENMLMILKNMSQVAIARPTDKRL